MTRALRRRPYAICSAVLWLAALAGSGWIAYIGLTDAYAAGTEISGWIAFGCAAVCAVLLPVSTLVHECGHLLFGALSGMRFDGVQIGWLYFSARGVRLQRAAGAGETRCAPRRVKTLARVRTGLSVTILGGACCNLLYAAAFFALFFVFSVSPALMFFACFAPLNAAEALCALLPADLPAGKTDGLALAELSRKDGETEIAVRVMAAQAFMQEKGVADLPREWLFETPVIREDSPAFLQLLELRREYLLAQGDTNAAVQTEERLAQIKGE